MATKNILYVEDEPILHIDLAIALTNLGFNVIEAWDEPSGIQQFDQYASEIGAVVTDLRFPKGSGFGIIEHIRKSNADLPIIVVSGSPKDWDEAIVNRAELTKGIQFFPKPSPGIVMAGNIEGALASAFRNDPPSLEIRRGLVL